MGIGHNFFQSLGHNCQVSGPSHNLNKGGDRFKEGDRFKVNF